MYSWWTRTNIVKHPVTLYTKHMKRQTFTRLTIAQTTSCLDIKLEILVAVGDVVFSYNLMNIDCYNDGYVEFLQYL